VPYYGASGQAGWIDDYLFDERLLLVAEDGENLVSRKLPIAYSIEGKSWVNNHAHVLRVTEINQFFLKYYFNSIDLSPYLTGTTRPKLNKASLLGISISKPSCAETNEIALLLSNCDAKIAALEQEAKHLDELFHAMLDELMTGKRSAIPLIGVESVQSASSV
jgi:type I restriction enzyme S subunit